ncbi:hypothetical protein ACEPPN_012419 [Leptodophora sp. 'Broadleaf-Isolate-01']
MAADKDTGVTFLYPPAGLTFNYLDTINVSYTSPFSSPYLVTYCLRYNGGDPLEKNAEYGHAYNSSTLALIKWPEFASCYFTLRPSKSGGNGSLNTNSPWFRINSEARPTPVTFGLDQNSTTVPTDPTTSTPAPGPSGGLSSAAKIGIGVGVALGLLFGLGAAAIAFCLLWRRKRARRQAGAQLLNAGGESSKSEFGAEEGGHFMPMKSMPVEMQGKGQDFERPHELSSDATVEMGSDRRIGELSAGEGVRNGPG